MPSKILLNKLSGTARSYEIFHDECVTNFYNHKTILV